jgi:hypothetical protein
VKISTSNIVSTLTDQVVLNSGNRVVLNWEIAHPGPELARLAERARAAFKVLQERFGVELLRYQGQTRVRRSTALRNPECPGGR